MFEERDLLYFDPFKFENGTSKPKYFLVLKNIDGVSILASLPTSKDHVPGDLELRSGCFEIPERRINIYVFLAGTDVAVNSDSGEHFSFEKNTFIYGANIDSFPIESFIEQESKKETTITMKGKLKQEIFDDLVNCLKKSFLVKNKFKKLL